MAHAPFGDDLGEYDEDGMDDPVVLRGLLQAVVLTLYFAVRYLLDVVFTPRAVQAASHKVLNVVFFAWHASWATPIASLVALQLWSSVGYGTLVRWGLRGCVVRGIWATLMDNSIVVAGLTKRQVWVPVLWWAEFTRISSGRVAPHGPWTAGPGRALCCVAPWAVRVAVLAATLPGVAWHGPNRVPENIPDMPMAHHVSQREGCTSYAGFPVPCDELERVRRFNRELMPKLLDAGVRGIRKAMNEHGFPGHIWHVGHACPDPSKTSTTNREDYGWNLFAQHAVDNSNLGHCLVSCEEAAHLGAAHVRCTHGKECIAACEH